MKYNQWHMNQNSLFYELLELNPTGVLSILGVEQMNFFFSIHHGNKEVIPSIETVDVVTVAKMIHSVYSVKWEKLYKIYVNDFEIGFDSSTRKENINIDTSNKNVNMNKTSQVSAFNDDTMTNVSGDVDSTNEIGERETSLTSDTTTLNLKSVDFQRALLENSNISNVIGEDISKLILLSVY